MTARAIAVGRWLRRRAENIAAAMMATMFIAFLFQIVFRYILNWPAGWAYELSIVCWLWGVLFGAAFIVSEKDEIRFDVIHSAVGRRTRRGFALVAGLALIALYGGSLPAVFDYVSFMKVERTAYLRLPFNWLYFVYVVFAVATVIRYLWLIGRAIRADAPASDRGEAPDR